MNSMKSDSDYITMPCSQAVADMLVVDNPQLAKLGMDGFDIYDYFFCDWLSVPTLLELRLSSLD